MTLNDYVKEAGDFMKARSDFDRPASDILEWLYDK